ncbi:hypothetical protein NGB36_00320 [Streptomyces sp. RB6PN25]|uniref:Uncharacterized protein n=1 Tax=Streptomyces humicola TaxID=2953240 RepID=A0ABT1PN54_9ACTN|nr:toluene-4-monooxygenase system B family protein [Streptomyces humicola]MCQ4079099.1 hypothetical protein [Streptomyces humicola]
MIIPLYGFFEGDFLGLVLIAMPDQPVSTLAEQLSGWVLDLRVDRTGGALEVLNEAGEILDQSKSIEEAGLGYGDMFHVRQAA